MDYNTTIFVSSVSTYLMCGAMLAISCILYLKLIALVKLLSPKIGNRNWIW